MTRFHTYKPRKQIETIAPFNATYWAKFGDSKTQPVEEILVFPDDEEVAEERVWNLLPMVVLFERVKAFLAEFWNKFLSIFLNILN